ncbi:2,6-dihydropseudooxynicotine hydrolase [bacterium YEK0313]|nr:2,6-dihydropseudooxynicotine hydrolase [bacterium YEK0313]
MGSIAQNPAGGDAHRFFKDQTYHFQALRVLSDAPSGGADIAETLEAIGRIREGDPIGWHDAWAATARRNSARAAACLDPVSRGLAHLRAHTYWRTAEFLLKPEDERRPNAWAAQIEAFDQGLRVLGIAHTRFEVPYEGGSLRAIHYPGPAGSDAKPLVVMVGGYDSTLEELYFVLVEAAHRRGYGVLTYEGPGQGAALRRHGLTFTHEWERPNAAVLDAFLSRHPAPPAIVLVGMSMGGYLAPRAAAFDRRIDGVVAYDVFYDVASVARRFAALDADPATRQIPGVVWAIDNARWTLGVTSVDGMIAGFAPYRLEAVAHRIAADVLILAGEADHFVPLEQAKAFEAACVAARSVETVMFDRPSGGAEHCQLGAPTLWHETFFDWMIRRFGGALPR